MPNATPNLMRALRILIEIFEREFFSPKMLPTFFSFSKLKATSSRNVGRVQNCLLLSISPRRQELHFFLRQVNQAKISKSFLRFFVSLTEQRKTPLSKIGIRQPALKKNRLLDGSLRPYMRVKVSLFDNFFGEEATSTF